MGFISGGPMIPHVRFCTTSCLVFVSALATAQVLTKSNSGLTTPEYVQVLAHSSGSIPLPYLTSLSAQDVNGDGKPDLLTTGIDPLSNPVAITSTLLRNAGSENFTQVFGNNSSYCQPVPAYAVAANTVAPFCTLADLNGDGLPDKIFAGEYPNASNPGQVDYPYIKVEYASGRGTWAAPVKYGIGGRGLYIASVATGDFNGDGRTDIAVLELSQTPTGYPALVYGNVYVLWGNAGGSFTLSAHGYPTNLNNYVGNPSDAR